MAGSKETMIVEENLIVEGLTVTADGTADILYKRTITNTSTGEVVVSDVVRETTPVEEILIDPFINSVRAACSVADGSAKAKVTKQQICKG